MTVSAIHLVKLLFLKMLLFWKLLLLDHRGLSLSAKWGRANCIFLHFYISTDLETVTQCVLSLCLFLHYSVCEKLPRHHQHSSHLNCVCTVWLKLSLSAGAVRAVMSQLSVCWRKINNLSLFIFFLHKEHATGVVCHLNQSHFMPLVIWLV